MSGLVKIGKGITGEEGSCNFCKRGELIGNGRGFNYPYTHVTTLSTANSGGIKVNMCEDCLAKVVLSYEEEK